MAVIQNGSKKSAADPSPVLRDAGRDPPEARCGPLFPWSDRTSVYRWLRPLSQQTLGQRFTPHQARHNLGTWLANDNATRRTTMSALGHADPKSS